MRELNLLEGLGTSRMFNAQPVVGSKGGALEAIVALP
jgi:hypothetical protein